MVEHLPGEQANLNAGRSQSVVGALSSKRKMTKSDELKTFNLGGSIESLIHSGGKKLFPQCIEMRSSLHKRKGILRVGDNLVLC